MLNGLVEHYASPTSRTYDRIERFYQAPKNQGWKLLEELGTGYPDAETGFFLDLRQCRIAGGIAHDQVWATFVRNSGGVKINYSGRKDGEIEYIPGSVEVEQEVETLSGYLKNWNNHLYEAHLAESAPTGTVPAWWETDDGSEPLSAADAAKYCWSSRDPGQLTRGGKVYSWTMIKAMTKPGKSARLSKQIVVYERMYYKNYDRAAAAQQNSLQLKAPPVRYLPSGCSAAPECWLYHVDGNLSKEDNGFIANNRYAYSPNGWDLDFYGVNNA